MSEKRVNEIHIRMAEIAARTVEIVNERNETHADLAGLGAESDKLWNEFDSLLKESAWLVSGAAIPSLWRALREVYPNHRIELQEADYGFRDRQELKAGLVALKAWGLADYQEHPTADGSCTFAAWEIRQGPSPLLGGV